MKRNDTQNFMLKNFMKLLVFEEKEKPCYIIFLDV